MHSGSLVFADKRPLRLVYLTLSCAPLGQTSKEPPESSEVERCYVPFCASINSDINLVSMRVASELHTYPKSIESRQSSVTSRSLLLSHIQSQDSVTSAYEYLSDYMI